ncbi:MAG: divalent metal cation transporter [Ktedonobacteraceae bacterium]|nr:divalent metal cation transporter [Ktedonobacteraceae bacterium]
MSQVEEIILMPGQDEVQAAYLDSSHTGDIHGAWGTIKANDGATRQTWLKRLMTLLVIMGPGLITMVGDNDAGGVQTYLQAGQQYGTSLLWTLLILIPVLVVNQEMVVRLGAVSGVGHARLIFERFGKLWGMFAVSDLFLLNFLTIVTEFIGFATALQYFGLSPYLSVPLGVLGLIAITLTGSFRRWESVMWVCCLTSLLMIPLAFIPHGSIGPVVTSTLLPSVRGGLNSTALLTIVAIIGTTVTPWQLFFQQSNVVDKRISVRWLKNEQADTIIGAFLTNIEAAGLIIGAAFAFAATKFDGAFTDVGTTAHQFGAVGHPIMGVLLMIVLLNASIIGACAVSLSTSYAFGDAFKTNQSLHRTFGEAKMFYCSYAALLTAAGSIVVLSPPQLLAILTLVVQALAGTLLPGATLILLLLCNDRDVLGPWVNKPWFNAIAVTIVGALITISVLLTVTTLLPLNNEQTLLLAVILGAVLVVSLLAMGGCSLLRARRYGPDTKLAALYRTDKMAWRMPPFTELPRPAWSLTRKLGMFTLRAYLIIAVLLLAYKFIQLAFPG